MIQYSRMIEGKLAIGAVILDNPVVLAPMAGVTDLPFRTLAREMGCGLVYTGMISDRGLVHGNAETRRLLSISPRERPVGVQIFGSEPAIMARAAEIAVAAGADLVDINMGCPVPKVVKGGAGAALMRDPRSACRVVEAVAAVVSVPVTVKLRKGWDEAGANAVEVARAVVEAGARAVTVHGRTRDQFYGGRADWAVIARVKEAVDVPVIGNGDVWSPRDAGRVLEETGCDGVMIGRAALGNPWIFRQTVHFLRTGELLPPPTPVERVKMALRHLEGLVAFRGEYRGVREMRKHAAWYMKGLPGASRVRERCFRAETAGELSGILAQYQNTLWKG